MIELFKSKLDCCGCTACASVCPQHAISMLPDQEGFLYPTVKDEICVECRLCQKACAFQTGYETENRIDETKVYAVKHKLIDVRYNSSSGGMFTVISDYILSRDGVVYGVGFDDHLVVCHQRADNSRQRDKFRGSKYVQSEMRKSYKEAETDLKNGKEVLFTGTPCQVAGFKKYLNQISVATNNLLLCDVVCHGTPSPLIFADYLRYCEKNRGQKIVNYSFRCKVYGWHKHTEKATYSDGKEDYKSFRSQIFRQIFYSNVALRPACYNCMYANLKRPSDFTIGDFWGIENTMPDFDDNNGISLVLINSPKAQEMFDSVSNGIIYKQSNIADCIQPNLVEPSKPSALRDVFWRDYYDKGFEYVIKKYFRLRVKSVVKSGLKKLLGRHIINLAKKLIGKLC